MKKREFSKIIKVSRPLDLYGWQQNICQAPVKSSDLQLALWQDRPLIEIQVHQAEVSLKKVGNNSHSRKRRRQSEFLPNLRVMISLF